MTRQLHTLDQRIDMRIARGRADKTRRAWLMLPYRDKTAFALLTFSDPVLQTIGTVVRARISPGLLGLDTAPPNLDAGHPVTVVIRRGQTEVVAY